MEIYIYTLSHPITNEIRYVGKTGNIKRRYNNHISNSKKINSHIGRWIKSLLKENLLPTVQMIEKCTEHNWEEREIYWISFYKEKGYNLCNLQKGGNQPKSYKKAIKKYYITKENRCRVSCSFNNTNYYLGTFDTKDEAIKQYDLFKSNPIKYINTLTKKSNKSGVNMYKDGNLIESFNSVTECAKYLNTELTPISRVCRNKSKTHLGYTFKYRIPL